MIVTNLLTKIQFSGLTGTLPTTWDISPTYPNGALATSQVEWRSRTATGDWTFWTSVTSFDNTTNIATQTLPVNSVIAEFRRNTPRYDVYLDPELPTSRVSQNNLQVNADQGLYTAIEWAAQFGIDAQVIQLPDPGTVPNDLGLQQQTQNYWIKADYTTHVWNFQFAGGYIARSHVKAQVLLSTGWQLLDIDTAEEIPQYGYCVTEGQDDLLGGFDLTEDGKIERREGTFYDNDPNTSPFRFIGPYQLYMDFTTLPELPQALIIYRHTPRNVKVNSPLDDVIITADGMDPSTRHALFVAVEIGEQLSQYAPPCDCFAKALEDLGWSFPNNTVHTSTQSATLKGDAALLYEIDLFLTGRMEVRDYTQAGLQVVGGGGRFVTAPGIGPGGIANIYQITISDPPKTYYMNQSFPGEGFAVEGFPHPDGSDNFRLSIVARGNATVTFSATDVEGASTFYPQFGTVTAVVTGSNA